MCFLVTQSLAPSTIAIHFLLLANSLLRPARRASRSFDNSDGHAKRLKLAHDLVLISYDDPGECIRINRGTRRGVKVLRSERAIFIGQTFDIIKRSFVQHIALHFRSEEHTRMNSSH